MNAVLAKLYALSESRGKESAGLHAYLPGEGRAWTLKAATRATELLNAPEYRALMTETLPGLLTPDAAGLRPALAVLAHSRLVTNGAAELPENNQPVRAGAVTMIHNGIVVNVDALWRAHPALVRKAEVDTEVMAAMLDAALAAGTPPETATRDVYGKIRGAASVAWVHAGGEFAVLATNTGDIYYYADPQAGVLVFASERFILESALPQLGGAVKAGASATWLAPGQALRIELADLGVRPFALAGEAAAAAPAVLRAPPARQTDVASAAPRQGPVVVRKRADESLLRYDEARIRALKRCSRCVLPETFPFIEFDAQGVCNYCHSYVSKYKQLDPVKAREEFLAALAKYRRAGGAPDALVPFSGGRDSSYGLHLIKKEFGFNPITFTYDWGMVTDLARRNIARICGQLGVQNILVSADIAWKRDNIRRNVAAWLHQPDLGLVPLFMAGDKHFFSVVNQLKRQTGIKLDLWSANMLEVTEFKTGFCGVRPDFERKRIDSLTFGRKVQMALYYASRFAMNPRYVNRSLLDTLGAFWAYYFEPRRDFFFMFQHIVWNEHDVDATLKQYDWELAVDTQSTWRIGDGTAPFYNYIYMTARGFSEFDTFRSNQIREGMIGRDEALESVLVENRPRGKSLVWYLETIGLPFDETIRRINELDTLGLHGGAGPRVPA
jgi:hypothetical protein